MSSSLQPRSPDIATIAAGHDRPAPPPQPDLLTRVAQLSSPDVANVLQLEFGGRLCYVPESTRSRAAPSLS